MSKAHLVLLVIVLMTAVYSQATSLKDFFKGFRSTLPANCLYANRQNQCITCAENFSLRYGQCVKIDTSASQFNPPDSFIPCGNADSCGEAKNFQNDQEFESFANKYAPQPQIQYTDPFVIPNIRPAIATQNIITRSAESSSQTRAAKALPVVDSNKDFSGTNNQVNGVDEADLLKTDGTYIYTISNQILSIILAYPASEAILVSKLSFIDFNPSAIFIHGDYLAVFGTKWQGYGFNYRWFAPRPYYAVSYTYIKIYDVSNRGTPFLLKQFQVSGSYFNGRKLENGFMYLITNQPLSYVTRPWYNFGSGQINVPSTLIFWYPITYVQPSTVNIIAFNLGDPINSLKTIVSIFSENAGLMYMSERHIYLTSNAYENGRQYTIIRKIFVYQNYIRPFADGQVQGTLNNQFSMDQYYQFFRVATTTNKDGTTSNNLFVLDYYLNIYGSLTGIAPTQRIYSVRYVGQRCYMVTFRQIDPFFVISLTNHRRPTILGQLKVPGFSRYLHPYDETTIVGLGRQATNQGRLLGLKISLFDVSDVRNPLQSASFEIEQKYAYSNAEFQHKAFLLSPQKNLLVIPGNMDYDGTKFNGAFAFYITPTQITLKSIIDHILNPTDNFYTRTVERSLYIEQLLYTKSSCLLLINQISEQFESVKYIKISCDQTEFNPISIRPIKPIRPNDPIPRPLPIFINPIRPIDPIPRPLPIFVNPISSIAAELAAARPLSPSNKV